MKLDSGNGGPEQEWDCRFEEDNDPRIEPGEYQASCMSVSKIFRYGGFKLKFTFQILPPSNASETIIKGYCPLPGKGEKIGKHSKLLRWSTIALGRKPTRFDRPSHTWFQGKVFLVKVGFTEKLIPHTKRLVPKENQYSVVQEILECLAGGKQ